MLGRVIATVVNPDGSPDVSPASSVLGGDIEALDKICTFLFVGLLGALSDVVGRKPVMAYSALGFAITCYLQAQTQSGVSVSMTLFLLHPHHCAAATTAPASMPAEDLSPLHWPVGGTVALPRRPCRRRIELHEHRLPGVCRGYFITGELCVPYRRLPGSLGCRGLHNRDACLSCHRGQVWPARAHVCRRRCRARQLSYPCPCHPRVTS